MQGQDTIPIECHPWQPFLPEHTRLLMLGSFPPSRQRWCMDFFYPNFQNDMWRIFGLCLHGDALHFVDVGQKAFRRAEIEAMLRERGVGLYDTARVVRRTRNTASDKDLPPHTRVRGGGDHRTEGHRPLCRPFRHRPA